MGELYPSMKSDADGEPTVGRAARTLGVRVEGPHVDVTLYRRETY